MRFCANSACTRASRVRWVIHTTSASPSPAAATIAVPTGQLIFSGKLVICSDIPYPPQEFFDDASAAKHAIEDAAGCQVAGYRASGFSVTRQTPWFFEKLVEAGYRYDSSVFPGGRSHGGISGSAYSPYLILTPAGELMEFPITLTRFLRTSVCLFGGGYLRLAPWPLIRRRAERILRAGRPVVFYLHPREIDPDQPRLPMGRRG